MTVTARSAGTKSTKVSVYPSWIDAFFFVYRKVSQSYRDGGVEAESTMGHGFSNDSPAMSKQSASFGSL